VVCLDPVLRDNPLCSRSEAHSAECRKCRHCLRTVEWPMAVLGPALLPRSFYKTELRSLFSREVKAVMC
jgi:hypothetical protein